MNPENPYQSPLVVPDDLAQPNTKTSIPAAVSTEGTIVPRVIAANIDNLIAMILGFGAAFAIPKTWPLLQLLALVVVYLGYYLLSEGLMSRTPGKLVTGLVVIPFGGGRCTWRQVIIRTLFRVLEVNPALFGALPAALFIVLSENRQRLGDKSAGTIVVPARRARKKR